ncbi:MAG TPA: glycosyltransferase [Pirellulales bacterium]|jgi:mannosylfructose-phosphate synthase
MIMPNLPRVMMISTHGYVSARPVLGQPDTGGQVVYVLELSRSLGELGYAVDIFTRRFAGRPALEAVTDRVRVVSLPCGGDSFIPKELLCRHIPEWVANVERYVRGEDLQYEFIDSHYWDAGMAGAALAESLTLPHVHTPHSLGSWKRDQMRGMLTSSEMEAMYHFDRRIREERKIYAAADLVIATTRQQREILMANEYAVPVEQVEVIPPGYDDRRFFPVAAEQRQALKTKLGMEGKVVFAVGRLARNKGYDLLLRAMPHLFARVPDARLMLAVGSPSLSADEQGQRRVIERLIKALGIADRVVLRDYIPDDALADHYRAADVFALSSRYEPFGMTAIEAMACGTPTVVTTAGGLWEELTWGLESVYANPRDPAEFGHALSQVLSYEGIRQQLSRFGDRRVRNRFRWPMIGRRLLQALYGKQQPVTFPLVEEYLSVSSGLSLAAPRAAIG